MPVKQQQHLLPDWHVLAPYQVQVVLTLTPCHLFAALGASNRGWECNLHKELGLLGSRCDDLAGKLLLCVATHLATFACGEPTRQIILSQGYCLIATRNPAEWLYLHGIIRSCVCS